MKPARKSIVAATIVAASALFGAGCGRQGGAPGNAPAKARAAAPAAGPATLRLYLAGNGLALGDTATGGSRLVAFGTSEAAARAAVEPVTGASTARTDDPNCRAQPAFRLDYRGGLSLSFEGGRFAAWEQDASSGYRMRDGIAIGTTRDALRAQGPVALHRVNVTGSVMEEFAAGAISGVLLDGKVQDFTAGQSACR